MDHWYIPGFIKDAVRWLAEKITELATWIWNKIKEVLVGVAAPVYFFTYAFDWQDIRGVGSAAMATAVAAFGSAVFSWAGAALIVEEAGVNSGLIWAAVGALTAALGTQAQQLIGLHGEAIDNSTFPGGNWPDPATGAYSRP